METITRQAEIFDEIKRIRVNFGKDSAYRKTAEYIANRLELLDSLWEECQKNDLELQQLEERDHQYFKDNIIKVIQHWYEGTRREIATYQVKDRVDEKQADRQSGDIPSTSKAANIQVEFDSTHFDSSADGDKMTKLQQLQNANFRALERLVKSICLDDLHEKWEIEDRLKYLESRWNAIDKLHLQIDGLLEGLECNYYYEFSKYESQFELLKRKLNLKLNASAYQQHSMPKLEIPFFNGNYTLWPTFLDLYTEAIHNNSAITKVQKMQHLKGRLRGEAEKLVQHLNITAENYDTCWELLNHRYNNKHMLFTKSFQVFMRQPNIQKQSAFDLKRLYDTSNECIHAIHNLGIDTSSWDPMLVYILCEKLDSETYTEYMQSRIDPREIPAYDNFMDFIENKFMALEPLHRKKTENTVLKTQPKNYLMNKQYTVNRYNKPHFVQTNKTPYYNNYKNNQTSNFSQFHKSNCPSCKGDHELFQCSKFIDMTNMEKLEFIAKHKVCKNCLYVHTKGYCGSQKRCRECNERHNTLLHTAVTNEIQKPMPSAKLTTNTIKQNNFVASNDDEILLATALIQVLNSQGDFITLRALIDQGSQITLITEDAAEKLGLQRQQLNASIRGIGTLSNKSRGKISLLCKSLHNDFRFTTEAVIMTRVVNKLPNTTFVKKNWSHTSNIALADPDYNVSRPIDILFDAHVFSEILMNGLIKGGHHEPMVQQTQIGWILSGNVKTYNCHVVINDVEDLSRYWEVEDVSEDAKNTMTSQEQYCENLFINTTKRLENGRYEVKLPMKENFQELLGKSKPRAIAQFMQLERRLFKDRDLSDSYIKFMQEYLEMGHMKESQSDITPCCYLPHHGVLKQDSLTTKLRVVFNASQRTDSGYSLNDLMECGPKLHHDLLTLLIGWRLHKYVFTADCEKMYRMILVSEEDQQLQKIVWRDIEKNAVKEYQLCTVTYGTKSAPFLALRTLKQLAIDDAEKYPLAANVILNEMYVDDVLTGSNSLQQAQEMQTQLINMMQGAGFNLRKWASNDAILLKSLSTSDLTQSSVQFKTEDVTKMLGLQWNPNTDNFMFENILKITCNDTLTKRKLLSEISKIFDPLGWLTPVTVKAKLLFQRIWLLKCDWDEKLSKDIQDSWEKIVKDIHSLKNLTIPRWIGDTTNKVQIHGFCDASEKVYACAIYLQTFNESKQSTTRLIAAKSKLAPLNKKITLPRLELCGAVLLTRLLQKVIKAFKWDNIPDDTCAWTDSMIVLSWLNGDVTKWNTFVSNRVKKVHDVIPKHHWKYVKSEENAADCATRGITCSQLTKSSLWWYGPEFLLHNTETITNPPITDTNLEIKGKQICAVQFETSSIVLELIDKYSDITHIIRVFAWMRRFISSCKKRISNRSNYLTKIELEEAENCIIKHSQLQNFEGEIRNLQQDKSISVKSNLLSMNPFLDKEGLLRVGGRLNNSELRVSAKNPGLLPHNTKLTDLLIKRAHQQVLHGGPKLTLMHLRQKYWILGGLRAVKRVLHQCVTCRRHNATNQKQIMADLPESRVTITRPFSRTGVDFTGHVKLKASKGRGIKTLYAYIAVFVCLVTKAIHLELVTELSSFGFLAAFKRFCARRGTPCDMYSDNGTNFVGGNKILMEQYKSILQTLHNNYFIGKLEELRINWHFNAPAWPSAGGLWESAVKSMKYHLKRVLGDQILTYEELSTLLCQIEACLNSRPLCTLTENIEDLDCLTPGHFLTGTAIMSVPEVEQENYDLRKRWQIVQKLGKDFWKRWSQEYLQQLQTRSKWKKQTRDLEINDIVCIKDENLPTGRWALGRIKELHPGKDGHTRVVTLKTMNGELKRPIVKLVPLVQAPTESEKGNDKTKRKQYRKQNISWKNLLVYTFLSIMTLVTPTVQQETNNGIKLTNLNQNQTIYFDKLAELQEIRDEWKIIFYYNMTSYWKNVNALTDYVSHLQNFKNENWATQFQVFLNQIDQSTKEIGHYNNLLKSQNYIQKRYKRGLIDGVGYIANSLFGVLDQRFAEQYENDIKTMHENESHLLQLLKNQTSIVEAQENILKRNEGTMITHFQLIQEQLNNLENETMKEKIENENAFYIITSAIAAESMIHNIKYIQETLVNTLINMYHGHIDVHLLSPEQLLNELNKIARHLQPHYILPNIQDVREIYKMLRIHARMINEYLVMEVKVPILSDESYELDKLISIPQRIDSKRVMIIIPTSEIIAFNANQYTFIPLNHHDLYECHNTINKLMCKMNHPIYNTNSRSNSICDIQLVRDNERHDSYCHSEIKPCTDKWIKLHKQNTWFYYCCDECIVHVMCSAGMTSEKLRGTGLLTLAQGCVLRGDTFMLYANTELESQVTVDDPTYVMMPIISPVNKIINTRIKNSSNLHFETHEEKFSQIQEELESIKKYSGIADSNITFHDWHHYVMIYVILAIIITLFGIVIYCWRKNNNEKITRKRHRSSGKEITHKERQRIEEDSLEAGYSEVQVDTKVNNEVKFDKSTFN